MTEKELNQLYYLNKETALLQKNLDELKQWEGYKSPIITGMPRGTNKRDTSDQVAELVDLEKIINLNLQQIQIERRRLERYIGSISDAEIRLIFRLRHINGMTWEQIALEVGYVGMHSESTVRKKHRRYLDKKIKCPTFPIVAVIQ